MMMEDNNEYSFSHDFIAHYDSALEDIDASYKDSQEMKALAGHIDRYSSPEFVAEGGMKRIESCFDKLTSRTVAKATPKEGSKPEEIDLFIREAKITASLQHPNIVPIYELSVEDNKAFFTMKLLEGLNLQQTLKKQNLSQNELLEIYLKICDAISYAHSKGVLHLDIKPENIQLDKFGDVLVCDWGLAQNESTQNSLDFAAGTPGFMAPEQYNAMTQGPATDIYSLGALLFYIFRQEIPISGKDSKTIAQNSQKGSIKNPEVNSSIDAIILKAMSLEPDERYHSVDLLAAEIRAYMNGFATQAENASFLTLSLLLIKRSKLLSSLILFTIVLTAVFISNLNIAKKKAEKAQAESMQIRQETAPEMLTLAKREYKLRQFDSALEKVNVALKLNPQYRNALVFKARCLAGRHQFDEAIAIMEKVDGNPKFISKIKEIREIASKQHILESLELSQKIADLRNLKSPNLKKHFIYTCTQKYDLERRFKFAKRYLDFITQKEFNWSFDAQKAKLDISKNSSLYDVNVLRNLPIKELNISYCPVKEIEGLGKLPLTHLDVSYTSILDIVPVFKCPLKYLNIDGTNIMNIHGLANSGLEELHLNNRYFSCDLLLSLKNLKKIWIYKNSFSDEEIERLKSQFEVIIKN